MKIAVVGAGYVGLVTGACLADKGHHILCVDVDPEKVALINRAATPFHERGLEDLLRRHVGGRLRATMDLETAVSTSEVTVVCVGTPFDGTEIDLGAIRDASRRIGAALRNTIDYHVVAVKSTVVPGTTDRVVGPILEQASGKKIGIDFGLAMNPEFLTEGEAVRDFMSPDRLVLGGIDERTVNVLDAIYASFADVPRVRTNLRTAEMIKYASNALLATAISFANEVGNLCAAIGDVDVADVMRGLHTSRYLTFPVPGETAVQAPITAFLWPGCGFGGSCLPKDVQALVAQGRGLGMPMRVLQEVLRVNDGQPARLLEILRRHFPRLAGVPITVLGLAFRPDTDDVRESPAIPVIEGLLADGAVVTAYDPAANRNAARVFAGRPVRLADDLETAVAGAAAIVLVTRWPDFQRLPAVLTDREPQPLVVDGRRMLDRAAVTRYDGIGL